MAMGVVELLSRRASIVRPASAANSRASATCSLVRGRPASTSQPDAVCFQPRRRRPSSVTNESGARPAPVFEEPKSFRVSILWTFATASSEASVPSSVVMSGMTCSSVRTAGSARKSVR
jgi:hypothetical protein